MRLDNKIYDVLKWVAQYVLPGLGTLYFALAGIWGLPYGEQIVGTITAVDAFLGLLLGISTSSYQRDGTLKIDTTSDEKDKWSFELTAPIDEVMSRKTISLNVDTSARL